MNLPLIRLNLAVNPPSPQGGSEGFKPSYHRPSLKRGAVINELAVALTKLNAVKLILDERNGQTDITE